MSSFHKFQDNTQNMRVLNGNYFSDLEASSVSIYDVAMYAFMSEVLTLGRMNSIINTVKKGIDVHKTMPLELRSPVPVLALVEAYRGLCSASCEGLTAVGLAHTEFIKHHRFSLLDNFYTTFLHEISQLKAQIEQLTILSGWQLNAEVTSLQHHWFSQLLTPLTKNIQPNDLSAVPWCDQFFQICGFEKIKKNNKNLSSSFMLLGLFTSGALLGMRSSHLMASS